MKYGYEKLIAEHNLDKSTLPEEVQNAISYLQDVEKGITALKARLKKLNKEYKQSANVTMKIKQLDTWAIRGINEFLEGDVIKGDAPSTDDDILKLAAKDNPTTPPAAEPATPPDTTKAPEPKVTPDKAPPVVEATTTHDVDLELLEIYKSGTDILTLEEIKAKAPKSYALIFNAYKSGEENGLETSNFSLVETEQNNYKLSKI